MKNLMSQLSMSPHLMKVSNFHYYFIGGHMGGGFLVSQSQEAGGYLLKKKPKITVNKKEKEKE